MNVAIDISPLETDHAMRGIGVYTDRLTKALHAHQKQHRYLYFSRQQQVPDDADIVHIPYFDPFFLTMRNYSKPTVVTVHDLIPIRYAEFFPRGVRGEIKWKLQNWMLRTADRIITDSEASKTDIANLTQLPESIVDVVYLAPDELFFRSLPSSIKRTVGKKYSLPERYIMYTGDVNWNKNIPGLIEAFHLLKTDKSAPAKRGKPVKLLLVGKAFLNDELAEVKGINEKIRDFGLQRDIIKTGYVPQEEIQAMYASALFYIQPSYAEGFGLPPLEAMACGCPVVSSGASSLKEIAGPSIVAASPNPSDLKQAMDRCIALSAKRRRDLSEAGRKWAGRFTWKKTAQQTVSVYDSMWQQLHR